AVPAAALRLIADDGPGSWLVAGPSPTTDISGPAETLLLLLWGRTDLDDPRLQVEDRRRAQAVLAEPLTP
nr:maleylpyruvate isomerase family mycothiol-dependent enzyme [Actinomycetota bacterium]